jgi:hypothetical protein
MLFWEAFAAGSRRLLVAYTDLFVKRFRFIRQVDGFAGLFGRPTSS